MAEKFIPHICGDNDIYVPDRECTDCEELERRVTKLENTRLVQRDIKAGNNIIVEYDDESNNVTINADLSNISKQAILQALGYEEITLDMTDTNDNEHEWTVIAQIQTP